MSFDRHLYLEDRFQQINIKNPLRRVSFCIARVRFWPRVVCGNDDFLVI
jgi:hypothetical protein